MVMLSIPFVYFVDAMTFFSYQLLCSTQGVHTETGIKPHGLPETVHQIQQPAVGSPSCQYIKISSLSWFNYTQNQTGFNSLCEESWVKVV